MKIKSISLNDVKSYDALSPEISFQSGVNAIIGENGSGKSTLCEAIGFALFDFLHPYSQADFVREGKKSGRVSVTFESDHSEHVYRVERGVGLTKYDVFDVTSKSKVSLQGKDEVLSWLKDELGVPSSLDLQTLWKSSLGVPQGKFTNDFAETPSIRAQLFNPLLEVDVYRDLWKQMKNVTNVLVEKKDQVSNHINRLDSIVEELPSLEKQGELKKKQISNATHIVENLTSKIQETEQEKTRLEAIQQDIQKNSLDLQLYQEKQTDMINQIKQTKHQFEEAAKAKQLVSNHEKNYETYVSNTKKLENLLEKKKQKDALEKKERLLEKKQSHYLEKLNHLEKDVKIAKKSLEEMNALTQLVQQQEALEEKIFLIQQKQQEIKRIEKEIGQVKEKISRLRKDFQLLQKQIQTIKQKNNLARKKESMQYQKDELLQKQSILTHTQEELKESILLLQRETESMCPTCSRPLDEAHKTELISVKQQELTHIATKQKEGKKQLVLITEELKKASQAEQEVKRLPDLESMLEGVQKDAVEQKQKKNELEESLISLQSLVDAEQGTKEKLDKLNDPKSMFQKAKVRYEDHKDKQEMLEKVKTEFEKGNKQKEEISEQIKMFSSIQHDIDFLDQEQKRLKESYELFLRFKDASSKIDFWKNSLDSLQATFKEVSEKVESLSKELVLKKKEFDKDTFTRIIKLFEEQKQELTRQKTQIDEWKKQQKELDTRIQEKKKAKEELTLLQKKNQSLEKDIEFAEFLRETYQKTRPLVTEILVEEISREADRIYRELRGVPSEELSWKKDYEIVVYDSGNKRAFHKLSGGEKMCAALSVRLAILKLLSTLDVVFLDEPTTNLDDEKKENLVAQLRELSGFSQIFVISHDETFESMTEHVITLEKRNGSTQLLNHSEKGF